MIWMCFTAVLKRPDWHPAPTLIHTFTYAPVTPLPPSLPLSPTTQPVLKVWVEEFNRIFRKQKSRKDSGPDGISSACLNVCADQLAPVFTQIFNRLELNTLKTVDIIVDFKKNPPALPPLTTMDITVAAVESFRFLRTPISQDLKWDNHIDSIAKKAQ